MAQTPGSYASGGANLPLAVPQVISGVHPLPPAPLGRGGTAILGRYEEQHQDEESGFEHALHARTAAALQRGKNLGIASPDMIAQATAEQGVNVRRAGLKSSRHAQLNKFA